MDDSLEDREASGRRQIRGWRAPVRRGVQVAAALALAVWLLGLAYVAYLRWAINGIAHHMAGR